MTFTFLILSLFYSCNLKINIDEELSYTSRPDVKVMDNSGFAISTKLYTDNTKYINLYRQDVTDSNDLGDIINIAVLFPANINSNNKTYQFEDYDIYNDHKYHYKLRYYDSKNDEFSYSAWSETISTDSKGVEDTTVLTYTFTDDTFFLYEGNEKTLLLKNITVDYDSPSDLISASPTTQRDQTEYPLYPTLIFNKGSEKIAVELKTSALDESIHLVSYLPSEYWNVELSLEGIIAAQKIGTTDEEGNFTLQYIYWTPSYALEVKSYNESDSTYISQDTFTVDTVGTSNTYDYSQPK